MVIEGKVSSAFPVKVPAPVRDALGIEPGGAIRIELEAGNVRLRVVRPAVEDSLEAVWAKYDLGDLREAMGGDAGADGPLVTLFVACAELMAVRQPAALLGFLAMVQISVVWTMQPAVWERAGAVAQCHCVSEACTGGGGASGSGLLRSHACSALRYVRPWCAVAVSGHGSHAVHACRAGDGRCRLWSLRANGRGVWSR